MINFILIYLLIVVCYVLNKSIADTSYKKNILIVFVSAVSSSLVGLRPSNAGYDTEVYVNYYNSLKGYSITTFNGVYSYNFENDYCYKLWNYILSFLSFDETSFLYITAFVSVLLFIMSLGKLFKKDFLLIFLFFYSSPAFVTLFGNAIRQAFAISFFLYAFYFFFEKKKINMVACIVLCLLFHNFTGGLLIITLIALKLFNNYMEKNRFLLLLIILFVELSAGLLSSYIFNIFPIPYLEFTNSDYFLHYSFIIFAVLYLVFAFIVKIENKNIKYLLNVYFILTLLASLIWYNPVTFGRVIYLTFPFLCFFISTFGNLYKDNWLSLLMIFLMFFVGIYFFNQPASRITLAPNATVNIN